VLKKRFFLMLFQAIVVSILLITSNRNLGIRLDLSFGNAPKQRLKNSLRLLFLHYKMKILMLGIMYRLFLMKPGLGMLILLLFSRELT
jgi:hypothetical protein